jgi:hypothetical protein
VPIQILQFAEPGSDSAGAADEAGSAQISSEAARRLENDLLRYCAGEIRGRSFLVAGHRGAGKTTMVLSALQRASREADRGNSPMLPLMVPLLGPTLLPHPEDAASPQSAPVAEAAAGTAAAVLRSPLQHVLEQITLALYRALAQKLAADFRRRAREAAAVTRERFLLELAAQLELELDEYPGPARLRAYWEEVGALPGGLLFTEAVVRSHQRLGRSGHGFAREDQGWRELTALATASEAYRRISGNLSRKDTLADSRSWVSEITGDLAAALKELAPPAMALFAGSAVGATALASGSGGLGSSLAGVAVALASVLFLKRSITVKESQSAARDEIFIPDFSVATLDRVLPVLINRLRAARLAPVFVVDELDKVEGLSTRVSDMVRRMKKLVAENSFFCFLTDRTYFEEVRSRDRSCPYSMEYTYYTDRVFVTFSHRDFDQYLERVLVASGSAPPVGEPGASVADHFLQTRADLASPAPTPAPPATPEQAEAEADRQVLRAIIRHGAKMHAFDLRRELAERRGANGFCDLPPGAVRSRPQFRYELLMQIALEWLIESETLRAEIEHDPAFRRLAHDALYFISCEWSRGAEKLDLAVSGDSALREYLDDRMVPDAAKTPPANGVPPNGGTPTIDPGDFTILRGQILALAALLADPEKLREEIQRERTAPSIGVAARTLPTQVIVDAFPPGPLLAPAEAQGKPAETYVFLRDRIGRRKIGPDAAAPAWREHATFIEEFARAVAEVTGNRVDLTTCGSAYGLLPTSPAWLDVERAIRRLRESTAETANPEQHQDFEVLMEFATILERASPLLAKAFHLAGAIEHAQHDALPALSVMSELLKFRELTLDQVLAKIEDLHGQLHTLDPTLTFRPPVVSVQEPERLKPWADYLQRCIANGSKTLESKAPAQVAGAVWENWKRRLTDEPQLPFTLLDVICARAAAGPYALLALDISAMTATAWSDAFARSVRAPVAQGDAPMAGQPPWFPLAALERLGFIMQARSFFASFTNEEQVELLSWSRWPDQNRSFNWPQAQPDNRSALAALVIVVRPDSPTTRWLPSRRHAALVLGVERAQAFLAEWEPNLALLQRWLNFNLVIFDYSGEPPGPIVPPRAHPQLRGLYGTLVAGGFVSRERPLPLVFDRTVSEQLPDDCVGVFQPTDLDGLLDYLLGTTAVQPSGESPRP